MPIKWQRRCERRRPQEIEILALYNGQRTLLLAVQKSQGENTIAVVDGLIKALEVQRRWRRRASDEPIFDGIRVSVANVKRTLFEGAALTVLIVFLFLNSWRSTVITGLTLPIALIGTFRHVCLRLHHQHDHDDGAERCAWACLIDDAIVVRENIVRHVQMGRTAAAR